MFCLKPRNIQFKLIQEDRNTYVCLKWLTLINRSSDQLTADRLTAAGLMKVSLLWFEWSSGRRGGERPAGGVVPHTGSRHEPVKVQESLVRVGQGKKRVISLVITVLSHLW